MRRRPSTLLVALVGVTALTAACGLKQDQLDALKQQANAPQTSTVTDGSSTGGAVDPTTGAVVDPTTGGGSGASGIGATTGDLGTSGSSSTGGSTSGSTSGSTTGTTSGSTSSTGAPVSAKCSTLGQNVVGVTPTEIRIGIHAPQTGTGAPLPPSFAAGSAIYWNSHKVCGRKVVVDFQDDKYTPSTARAVCEPMSRRDFLIVGAAGTDQIQSCATDPAIAGKGVPYLSAGVTTNGLTSLPHYFAFSLTYAQQATLVLENARKRGLGLKKWAVITSNTNNFKDAREAMEGVLKSAGIKYDDVQVNATNDNGIQGRAIATGAQIAAGGYDTVFLDTSPGYFLYMSSGASKQGFNGTYTGPGVTMTEVTVAQLVCAGTSGVVKANFLAPYPGIDRASAEFKAAVAKAGTKYDDIFWSLWGLSQALDQALQNASSLTRPAFIASLNGAKLPGGVYAPIDFSKGHFGGTAAYSQVMDCNHSEPNSKQPGTWNTVGGLLFK